MSEQNYKTVIRRTFLLADLPVPLTRASEHLQLFDNYIENTRLRLRSVRIPQTKEWTRSLEQRFFVDENDLSVLKIAEIFLNQAEYAAFERHEGREIRKNRYFYKADDKIYETDVFMGALWGLCLANVYFETIEEMRKFETPAFVVSEVTNDDFFTGANLVEKTFADVQKKFEKVQNE